MDVQMLISFVSFLNISLTCTEIIFPSLLITFICIFCNIKVVTLNKNFVNMRN